MCDTEGTPRGHLCVSQRLIPALPAQGDLVPTGFPLSLVLRLPFYGTNKCLKLGEEKSLDKTKMGSQGHSLMCDN